MFDPNRPPPPPGTMQTMGVPQGGMPPQRYGQGGGAPANPGGAPQFAGMPPFGPPGGMIPAPGGGMPVPPGAIPPAMPVDAGGGIGGPTSPQGFAGANGLPNIQALKEALMGYRTDLRAWRDTRPEEMTPEARLAWRSSKPARPDFRGLLYGTQAPAPGVPGDPATNLPAAAPQGPAGTFGTQLGVIGMTPPNDSGLPGY